MGRILQWDIDAWNDYCEMQNDKSILKRINALIKDIVRDPFNGIGKPEALKHELSGLWSRRVNDKDRIVYRITDDAVIIIALKGHYN